MRKYADTYPFMPAINVNSWEAELENIEAATRANNLNFNRSKIKEIIFVDNKRRRQFQIPSQIPGVRRVTSLKYLALQSPETWPLQNTNAVVAFCSQSVYALKVLRVHEMGNTALRSPNRLSSSPSCYASCAWGGFASAADRQRIYAFIQPGLRSGLCSTDLSSISNLFHTADTQLFHNILANPNHAVFKVSGNAQEHRSCISNFRQASAPAPHIGIIKRSCTCQNWPSRHYNLYKILLRSHFVEQFCREHMFRHVHFGWSKINCITY